MKHEHVKVFANEQTPLTDAEFDKHSAVMTGQTKAEILMSVETRDRLLDNIRRNVPWVDADDEDTAKTYAGLPVRIVNIQLPHFCDDHKLHDDRCSICGRQVL